MNDLVQYFSGDEFAASTWQNKYALKDEDGNFIEKTPTDMHHRLASEFARIEEKYNDVDKLTENDIFELFNNFKYVIPGGSVLSGLGSKKPVSLSNCFVVDSPKDSYDSIMKTRNYQCQLMKRRGGVGYDLSLLRPRGAKVNNAANTSTGAASFMDANSTLTNEVAQGGRRGALMNTIEINHPDVQEFIEKKQDLTKVTGANISVKINDSFMKAVENEEDYLLRWPVDTVFDETKFLTDEYPYNDLVNITDKLGINKTVYIKKVNAKTLWDKLVHCAWNTAEPGVIFVDKMHNYAPDGVYENYKMISTNPCQPSWATVLTPDGIKTFGEINIGDVIWSKNGWTKIVNKNSSGIKDVYEYRTTAGSFYGTENHRLVSNGVKIEAKDAESIDVLAGCNNSIGILSENYLQSIVDGLVIGDGSVHKASNNLIYLCIGEKDDDYFESEIKNYIIKNRNGIKPYAFEVKTTLQPSDLPLVNLRQIPNKYYYGNSEIVKGFLKGLFSANGCVIGNRVSLKTTSSKLRDEVQTLLSSIGIRSYYTTNKKRLTTFKNGTYECKESYDISISTDRDIFYTEVGFIQKYKMEKLKETLDKIKKGDKTHDIISVNYISTEEVFNITVDNETHTYWTNGLNVSNCGEIGMNKDSCRLIAMNLTGYVKNPYTSQAEFDFNLFKEHTYKAVKLGDDLVDLELEQVNKILSGLNDDDVSEREIWTILRDTAIDVRRMGLGFTGLGDMLAMMGYKYGTTESTAFLEEVLKVWFGEQLKGTIKLAKMRGEFNKFDATLEGGSDFNTPQNDFFKMIYENYNEEWKEMMKYGRRNISWSTLAPCGSLSILTRTTSGVEPLFMPFYERKRKCVNPTDKVDYIDKVGEKYSLFVIVHNGLRQWAHIHKGLTYEEMDNYNIQQWQELYVESPYYNACAQDLDWHTRNDIQGIIQKYVSHSISSTCNLANDVTEEEVSELYIDAWKKGCKGTTIYRDGCREGVLTQLTKKKEDDKFNESDVNAPKRPKSLEADFYTTKVKGEIFYVMIGLYQGKPYEIFVYRPTGVVTLKNIKNHKGELTKVKKNHYRFDSDILSIDDLSSKLNTEELATVLYSSMLMRTGAKLKYIVKVSKKVDDNITSFTAAMNRIISKYIPNEVIEGETCPECGSKIIRENGCQHCSQCEWSKCE